MSPIKTVDLLPKNVKLEVSIEAQGFSDKFKKSFSFYEQLVKFARLYAHRAWATVTFWNGSAKFATYKFEYGKLVLAELH